jgi:hypothetical protein
VAKKDEGVADNQLIDGKLPHGVIENAHTSSHHVTTSLRHIAT